MPLRVCILFLVLTRIAFSADVFQLSPENWDTSISEGKEIDAIYGDYVLRNDLISVVIAQPTAWRKNNLTSGVVGGCLIDFTRRDENNDQLSGFYPPARNMPFSVSMQPDGAKARLVLNGKSGEAGKEPVGREHTLIYEIEDGKPFVTVTSTLKNSSAKPWEIAIEDTLRADNFDRKAPDGKHDLFWVQDTYWRAAYGVAGEHPILFKGPDRNNRLQYADAEGKPLRKNLEQGESFTFSRRIFTAPNGLFLRGEWLKATQNPVQKVSLSLTDPSGPVPGATFVLSRGEIPAKAPRLRTGSTGKTEGLMEPGTYRLTVTAPGHEKIETQLVVEDQPVVFAHAFPDLSSRVKAVITDAEGKAIPCKVQFKGVKYEIEGEVGTPNPFWGPKTAPQAVENLYYSENGTFSVPIDPGEYEAIVSYGPKYDVQRVRLKVAKAQAAELSVKLTKTVNADGWISADFHSHSSPSGDNTSDQRGRVLNLLCEHIDFAPCTEHARIDSYDPHLKALGVSHLMGTCSGMELTGTQLPLAHLNAFPLKMKPRTQNGGGPEIGPVEEQIQRLSEWDEKAEKLVQQNHPDIGWLFFDKNGDYERDDGYKEGFKYMNVMEVHPIENVLAMKPTITVMTLARNNRIFNWLQLLNLGHRIPGVVNTDAHYNNHGSGGIFNWIACSEKIPGRIDSMEIVRNSKKGQIVMSNGPFLRVDLNGTLPGGDLALTGGKGTLNIEVQSANWLPIDRVQVLVNGRALPKLNFTAAANKDLFNTASGVRFKQNVPLELEKDAHIIVIAVGENAKLGDVMGEEWGRQKPTAISNPIFVDVDGGGFKPNGDLLDAPIPVKGERSVKDLGKSKAEPEKAKAE